MRPDIANSRSDHWPSGRKSLAFNWSFRRLRESACKVSGKSTAYRVDYIIRRLCGRQQPTSLQPLQTIRLTLKMLTASRQRAGSNVIIFRHAAPLLFDFLTGSHDHPEHVRKFDLVASVSFRRISYPRRIGATTTVALDEVERVVY